MFGTLSWYCSWRRWHILVYLPTANPARIGFDDRSLFFVFCLSKKMVENSTKGKIWEYLYVKEWNTKNIE